MNLLLHSSPEDPRAGARAAAICEARSLSGTPVRPHLSSSRAMSQPFEQTLQSGEDLDVAELAMFSACTFFPLHLYIHASVEEDAIAGTGTASEQELGIIWRPPHPQPGHNFNTACSMKYLNQADCKEWPSRISTWTFFLS